MDYLTQSTRFNNRIKNTPPTISLIIRILLPPKHANWVLINYGQSLTQWAYWWGLPILQFLWASFVLDTWQYFWHRAFHINQFLYKHIHSATLLFGISTAKTVDDHCGLALPYDPFNISLVSNNAAYHDIHHQQFGIKKNFSQPYFVHWDVLMGTRMSTADAQIRRDKLADLRASSSASLVTRISILSNLLPYYSSLKR
ncbi:hypothetical protein KEM48_003911 [Puccinia striiformis f. sp. tritici PST-130]|nr:hypothetical protein KEM48_003911 [Puccinia striiformis f. sp. tritici PST-130]